MSIIQIKEVSVTEIQYHIPIRTSIFRKLENKYYINFRFLFTHATM